MNEKREKSENRRALPRFALTMLGSLLAGGVIGFVVGCGRVFGVEAAALAEGLSAALSAATPWGIPVTSVLTLGACFLLYRSAVRKFAAWGGGDEDETSVSAPVRFCNFSPNTECKKTAGKGVQPLNDYTCRFRPSSLKYTDKSGLDGLQADKWNGNQGCIHLYAARRKMTFLFGEK